MRPLNRDTIPHLVNCAAYNIRGLIDTAIVRLLAMWWGVKIGVHCRFFGLPLLRRLPGSTIIIGDNCTFNSAYWSSLVGVSRRCVVATLGDNAKIKIGDNCGLSGTIIGAAELVTLGDRVMAGANTTITDTDWHPLDPVARFEKEAGLSSSVVIEDDVWLGLNVVVLKGVAIGRETVVAANSVVVNSLPAGVLAAGVPAKTIRKIKSVSLREGMWVNP